LRKGQKDLVYKNQKTEGRERGRQGERKEWIEVDVIGYRFNFTHATMEPVSPVLNPQVIILEMSDGVKMWQLWVIILPTSGRGLISNFSVMDRARTFRRRDLVGMICSLQQSNTLS
jgi:hypothetical protein